MCIYLEWTTDSRDRSYAVFDHDHLDVLSQEEFRRAVEQLQYFIEDVIGTDPEIDRINGRICIYALAPDEPEQSEYDLWDSFVPASSPEDGEWKMMDLVALLDDLAQVERQGITSIDLCAGACTLPDGTSIRTTDWDGWPDPSTAIWEPWRMRPRSGPDS